MMRSLTIALSLLALTAAAAPPSAIVTTIAGIPQMPGYWDGPPQDAMFTHPTWLDVVTAADHATCEPGASGEIFVVDRINQIVRRIAQDGTVTTFAPKFAPAPGTPLPLNFGTAFGGGILVEPPGAGCGCDIYARGVFIVSSATQQIPLFALDGRLASRDATVVISTGVPAAEESQPLSIARSANGGNPPGTVFHNEALFIADAGTHTIRRVSFVPSAEGCPLPGPPTLFAGTPGRPGQSDGQGSAAQFNTPRGIAARPDGTVYVTDAGNNTIRKITRDGVVTTIAGEAGVAGSNDGPALQAHFNTPSGIDVNDKGEVFIVDTFNHTIRMLTTDGTVVTIAGQTGLSGFADGDAASAKFNAPVGLKIAPDGSIVIADTGNNVIRRLTLK